MINMPRNRVRFRRYRVRLDTDTLRYERRKRRVRLTRRIVKVWTPSWSNEIKGWTLNYLKNHFWRCEHELHDEDDIVQDAYCLFLKLADHYPRVVEPAHFMSLYKTSLRNLMHDKSRYRALKETVIDVDVPQEKTFNTVAYCRHNEAFVIHDLLSADPEIKMLMEFVADEKNLELLREPQRTEKGAPRMTIDQRLAKLLGTGPFPFKKRFKELLFG